MMGAAMAVLLSSGCRMAQEPTFPSGLSEERFGPEGSAAGGVGYLFYMPEGVTASGEKVPLLLFLHGSGERGTNLELLTCNGPLMHVQKGRTYPFMIAAPQCPARTSWSHADQLEALNALIDDLVATYPVDESRIYLTGLSMGGYGVWSLAAAYPDRFAAMVPVCGGGNPLDAPKFAGIPAWVFHGAKDTAVPIIKSEEMVDALKAAGAAPRFTVYPEVGHHSWEKAYDTPELYTWMLSQSKSP